MRACTPKVNVRSRSTLAPLTVALMHTIGKVALHSRFTLTPPKYSYVNLHCLSTARLYSMCQDVGTLSRRTRRPVVICVGDMSMSRSGVLRYCKNVSDTLSLSRSTSVDTLSFNVLLAYLTPCRLSRAVGLWVMCQPSPAATIPTVHNTIHTLVLVAYPRMGRVPGTVAGGPRDVVELDLY